MTEDIARQIAETVAGFPEGATISDLETRLDIHRRTIQRRLKELVERGELQRQGKGPATRYFATRLAPASAALDEIVGESEPSRPVFSDEAKEARRRIRAPLARRQPVSYRASLLDDYNDVAILRDLFVWAYHRSASRYRVIRESLGEPDPLRLRRREEIKEFVGRIIAQSISRTETAELLDDEAESLPPQKRDRFVELIWRELDSIHEGNFARYRVRPSQFESWRRVWSG